MERPRSRADFQVAIICALQVEWTAVEALFDEVYTEKFGRAGGDKNAYTTGSIAGHDVVLAYMPGMGKSNSAMVAAGLRSSYPNMKLGLVVGVCGAVPPSSSHGPQIYLGDVVISVALIPFDFGRQYSNKSVRKKEVEDTLGRADAELRAFVAKMQGRLGLATLRADTSEYLTAICAEPDFVGWKYPGADEDNLYHSSYRHKHQDPSDCDICAQCQTDDDGVCDNALESTCDALGCSKSEQVPRDLIQIRKRASRRAGTPEIHFGRMASGDHVVKSASHRDAYARADKVLAFEMEGAGVWDNFPCVVVIKGACDYADSHKNKKWQRYAAATGAACTKAFLNQWEVAPAEMTYSPPPSYQTVVPLRRGSAPSNTIIDIPFPRDPRFIGRETTFQQINEYVEEQHRVALHGLGGIGKSQIAIEYGYRYHEEHPRANIFWVYCADRIRFAQAYQSIARKLHLQGCDDPGTDTTELTSDWFNDEDPDREWLLIVDNADDAELILPKFDDDDLLDDADSVTRLKPLFDYLPKKFDRKRRMIVTTRSRRVGEDLMDGQDCLEVSRFSMSEASELLELKAKFSKSILEGSEASEIQRLLDTLGYIPLAITQAAMFMSRNRISLRNYVAKLDKDDQNLTDYLSNELRDPRRDRQMPSAVFRTWKLSFDLIQAQDPRAAELLSMMAMLDRQGIPESLLKRDDERDIEFDTAMGTLVEFSLVNKGTQESLLTLHRLVQLSIQGWLAYNDQKVFYAREALRRLASRFPDSRWDDWRLCESLFPHAEAVLRHETTSRANIIDRALLLYNVARFQWRQGMYSIAYRRAQESYRLREETLGPMHPETLRSLAFSATILLYQGKYETAAEIDRRALRDREKVLGPEHPDTLYSIKNLARVLAKQGKYESSEELQRRAWKGFSKVIGLEHPDTLVCANNLGRVLGKLGRFEEGEEIHREALEVKERVLGPMHVSTLSSVNNLALLLADQGKLQEAEEMNLRALEGNEKMLGLQHPYTLTSAHNLAEVLAKQGKYREAEEMNQRALEGNEKVLGAEHPKTLHSVCSLAYILHKSQRLAESDILYQKAQSGYTKALGPDHPTTIACSKAHQELLSEMENRAT